ncbi:hypothetical protein P3T39_002979 [Kitasatospora sp. GP82]|nr:hypothetical protein [Kitasatospora sp. GP82]
MLGLCGLGLRTLQSLSTVPPQDLVLACADGRWVRRRVGRRSITEEVREAIFAVRKECAGRSRISMSAKHRLVHQYISEKFPDFPPEKVPCWDTLAAVWAEWFGPEGGRQRYLRSADAAAQADVQARVVVHRPGQVIALDSTPLPVKLRESVFGEAVSATLTIGIDLFTHTVPVFRLTPKADQSVDIAMLLRDVMLPLPMREGWGEDMAWPYPGVPAEIVAEFAGHDVAALPFFTPETVTTDHGSSYRNHELVAAERELGRNILPARVLRPTDKYAVERAFSAFKTLLFEHLLGFTGTDVADRGTDPEADAVLTFGQMEHLIASWIVQVWQRRELGEYAPAWGPGERHSPNSLFAAAMQQGGFALRVPESELYYRLLRKHISSARLSVRTSAPQVVRRHLGRAGPRSPYWVILTELDRHASDLLDICLQPTGTPEKVPSRSTRDLCPGRAIPAPCGQTGAPRQFGASGGPQQGGPGIRGLRGVRK